MTQAKNPTLISPMATHASDVQLGDRYGVSRTTIWRWTQSGKFPKPKKLSPGCTRWKISEVDLWEEKGGIENNE